MEFKILKYIKYSYYIFFIPIFLIIRILRPFIIIRFDYLNATRIGHFSQNTEIYLAEKKLLDNKNKKYLDFFSFIEPISNTFLEKIIKRKINFLSSHILTPIYNLNLIIPGGEIHRVFINFNYDKYFSNLLYHDRDPNNILSEDSLYLELSKKEILEGEKILNRYGIKKNDKIVCLATRDNLYLKQQQFKNKNFSYHDYRNTNIEDYYLAIKYLADKGYYVFRMGAKTKKPLSIKHPKIIDYAQNGMRNEFLDIFLGFRCNFVITDTNGWNSVPQVFRKPVLFTNVAPILAAGTHSFKHLIIFKEYFSKQKQRILNLKEIIRINAGLLQNSDEYKKLGIKLIDNSSQQILDSTIDMINFIESKFKLKEEDILQKIFWQQFDQFYKDHKKNNETKLNLIKIHGKLNAKIPNQYLNENKHWLISN